MKALDWDLNVSELQFNVLKANFGETVDSRNRIFSLMRTNYEPPALKRADAKAGEEFSQDLELYVYLYYFCCVSTVVFVQLAAVVSRSQRREATSNTTQYPPDFDTSALPNTGLHENSRSGDWENEVDIVGVSYIDGSNSRKLIVTIVSRSTDQEETFDIERIYQKCPQKVRHSCF
ncbi:uncharacterized protein BKA55DRAFT_600066 [Fusarium redolens]|uniref:Uncharacterized protein n=1 Tax=Fusarium redolens TaxID=48865 RepID=A0A9P9FYJ0_FUSRE|nr:uncharacterized protein BKA55DRAFT_600066 [Fusarium redolens]KAH7208460.1 hypothetical protein BKA55DRAFT_600066 [Fusarium redolens]